MSAIVLIVDDERDLRDTLAIFIERTMPGTRVLVASTAAQGLEQLRRSDVDLILADYKMAGMDGLQFLKEAALRYPATPRVLMTAYPDLKMALRGLHEAGIKQFLAKPIDPQHLVEVLAELLSARRRPRLVPAAEGAQRPWA